MVGTPRTPLISVIVCVWNKVEITAGFLNGVWPWIKRLDAELVVVDDGSTDNTPRMLKSWGEAKGRSKFAVYRREKNMGFGPANNYGVGMSQGRYLVLINNDVEIRGNFIQKIMDYLLCRPDAVVCGRLVDWPSGWNTFNKGELTIPYAEGWLLGMHRETWNILGGFDEQFVPCDFEDVDLSMTAKQLEIDVEQLELPLVHQVGTTTRQLGDREKITRNNRSLFMEKWGLKP